MSCLRSVIGIGLLLGAASLPLRAADPPPRDELPPEIREAKKLSEQIDKLIAARWAALGIKPAKLTGDGEFIRRAHLDLTGRIPKPTDLLDFRNDYRDRYGDLGREYWINKDLLDSQEFVTHFATTWRQLIVPSDNNQMAQFFGNDIDSWLKQKFKENAHYDQIARELLASDTTPNSVSSKFFQANQLKPETIAATTSRLFLGVKLECAQCHDHPFARWTRKQFWETAAFFSGIQPPDGRMARGATNDTNSHEIQIPGTERVVQARFLDGKDPEWKKEITARETLVAWMLRSENPFFAKAAVNRFWAHFFGIGLVQPVDDLSDQNPASHPELLELLAKEFAAHDYDVKYLIRAITFSKTYQLSSRSPDPKGNVDPRLFARMNLKGLTGEQLYDSIYIAMDTTPPQAQNMRGFGPQNDARFDFVTRFARQDNPTEYHTSILQALTMMNGKLMEEATNPERCNTLKKISDEPLTTAQRVESLYMAVLARKPRPAKMFPPQRGEADEFIRYVDSGGPKKDPKAALGDVFWALLNSAEFLLNH